MGISVGGNLCATGHINQCEGHWQKKQPQIFVPSITCKHCRSEEGFSVTALGVVDLSFNLESPLGITPPLCPEILDQDRSTGKLKRLLEVGLWAYCRETGRHSPIPRLSIGEIEKLCWQNMEVLRLCSPDLTVKPNLAEDQHF